MLKLLKWLTVRKFNRTDAFGFVVLGILFGQERYLVCILVILISAAISVAFDAALEKYHVAENSE